MSAAPDEAIPLASGGQQQRAAVARSLVGQPSIILGDEPTGNLDSKNGEVMMELLHEVHRAGTTVCMVSHDPRYASSADHTIRLSDGRILDENAVGSQRLPIFLRSKSDDVEIQFVKGPLDARRRISGFYT
jgi:ABC-type lipoprotein export system ATPase subunit